MSKPRVRAPRWLTAVLMFTAPVAIAQEEADSLKDALAKGKPSVVLRYRYEQVADDALDKDAYASTLRTTLGYRTLPFKGFSLFLEAQNVTNAGKELFNNKGAGHLANDVTDRPVVVDPSQTRMQQAYLRLDALRTAFDFGRREIAYGDHRFIGDVGWRQNHQTFDAFYLQNHSFDKATLSYSFADKVIRIDGSEKDMSSHFLNGLVKLSPSVAVELFGYLIDYDEVVDSAFSSQSYGGKIAGSQPVGKQKILFEAQYAKQTDMGKNPKDVSADYLHLVGGVGIGGKVNLRVGRELLTGSASKGAFQTPLATGHKFNGWADKFLVTPPDGIVDWYGSADGKIGSVAWIVVYHDFSADAGGASYGTELDAQALYPSEWKMTFGFKLALYREDGYSTDTSKLWLWTQYAF